jgi:FMN-dependent NADH-azoreductase
MRLLEIQSSVRLEKSISRRLSSQFVQAWKTAHPDAEHKLRDVGINPPSHPTELWTVANYTLSSTRTPEMIAVLANSEQLIEELFWASHLLLGVPMYNFSVPSNFKTYLDNVVRVGRTFTFDSTKLTFQGLVTGKKALVIIPSAANYAPNTPLAKMDFCEPYLKATLNFIGIDAVTVIAVPNQFMSDEVRQQEIETAQTKLIDLAVTW